MVASAPGPFGRAGTSPQYPTEHQDASGTRRHLAGRFRGRSRRERPPPASNSADSDVRFTGVTPIRRDRGFVIGGDEAKMVIAAGVRLNDPCRGPRSRCCRYTPGLQPSHSRSVRTRHVWLQQVRWVTLVEPVEQHEFIVCPDADAQPGDDDTRASQLRRSLVHRHRRIAYPEMHVMEAHGLRLIGTRKGHETHEGSQQKPDHRLPVIISPRLVTIRML